jgi:N4-gp56 family major capsid protein
MAKVSELPQEALTYWSRIVYNQYNPISVLRQFVTLKRDLTAQPGKKIAIPTRGAMPKGQRLTDEYDKVPTVKAEKTYTYLEVSEVANSAETTQFLSMVNWQEDLVELSDSFGINYAETLEDHLLEALDDTLNIQFGDGKASIATIVAADTFSKAIAEEAQFALRMKKAPGFRRIGTQQVYIAYLHPHQLRAFRNDVNFLDISKYNNAPYLFAGEVGIYQNIVFIENPDLPVIPIGEQGATVDVYTGYMFGLRALGLAEASPFELRQDPAADLGRIIRLGWIAVYGTGLINDHVVKIHTA